VAHDLIIRSGTVVDGTGAGEPSADIAIDEDRITAVGGLASVGHHADIDVFDRNEPASEHPEYVDDLPSGAGGFRISSRGDAATIVNGVVVTEQGSNTGERPGRVVREFARG
jgi:N-acyl-D-aspartate/D-glutamate deacylase